MDLQRLDGQARGTGTRLDGLGVDLQALFLVDEEVFHGIALVALELDHVAGLLIVHNGTVAGKLLLDDLEDFLEIELGRDALDGGQGLATIALCAGQLSMHGRRDSRWMRIWMLVWAVFWVDSPVS
jgi:hypothetical protein